MSLSTQALKHLNSSLPAPSSMKLVATSSKLCTITLCMGGKAGASNLWRTSVDETLEFPQDTLLAEGWFLRCGQFYTSSQGIFLSTGWTGDLLSQEDPMVFILLKLDQLCTGIMTPCNLLRFVLGNSFFYQLSLTKLKVPQPHNWCKSWLVNYLNCVHTSCDATEQVDEL